MKSAVRLVHRLWNSLYICERWATNLSPGILAADLKREMVSVTRVSIHKIKTQLFPLPRRERTSSRGTSLQGPMLRRVINNMFKSILTGNTNSTGPSLTARLCELVELRQAGGLPGAPAPGGNCTSPGEADPTY